MITLTLIFMTRVTYRAPSTDGYNGYPYAPYHRELPYREELRRELHREALRVLDEGLNGTSDRKEWLLRDWGMELATIDFLLALEDDRVYQEEILRGRPTEIEP